MSEEKLAKLLVEAGLEPDNLVRLSVKQFLEDLKEAPELLAIVKEEVDKAYKEATHE